jgi:hypothetical protein
MRLLNLLLVIFTGHGLLCSVTGEHKAGEIIVRYTDDTTDFEKNKTAVQFELSFKKSFKLTNSSLYSFDANQSLSGLKKDLEKLECVKYVTDNKVYRKQSYDPDFSKQWYLENTGQLVNLRFGTSSIDIGWKQAMSRYVRQIDTYVAVLDSGFAKDHQELLNRHLKTVSEMDGISGFDDDNNGYVDDADGWDFIDNDNNPYDFKGHGTQVAGIISSNQDGFGIQGISPDAHIKPLRVLNREGSGSTAKLAEALEYIYFLPSFRILNVSLGSEVHDELVAETIKIFEKDDRVLIVCAAGNGGTDGKGDNNDQSPFYPSSYDSNCIISVSSINQSGEPSVFSNYGLDSVDIAAPGENIRVATINRELYSTITPDGSGWSEKFFWIDSIAKSWSRKLYGSYYWFESPRFYTSASELHPPLIDLTNAKDPRMQILVDYSLNWLGDMWLKGSKDYQSYKIIQRFSFSSNGVDTVDIDVSDFAGGNMWLKFEYFPSVTSDKFDIGQINISDVDTNWAGYPYYEFQNGTSFAAPVISGVASLVMSHRPDLLASDVKDILINSAQSLNSLSDKVKSGGMVRADKALELADTYRNRSSVKFSPSYNQQLTSDLKVKIKDIYLTYQEMTAGVLVGKGDYFEGDSITLKAMPEVGFNFEGWEESGEIISTDATYTFTSEFKDYVFKAIFTEDLSDPDNDELPNYAEALYGTDIEDPNTDNDALNDYDEWQVGWYGSSLRLLEDDSATISLLVDIIGEDSYKKGELAGIEKGKTSVTTDPYAYNLVTKTSFDQALLDANASAKQAITDAKVLAKAEGIEEGKTLGISEGESSVLSNPSVYNLVTKSSYDQALLDANATAEQAIANAQVSAKAEGINEGKAIGKSEGQSSVTSNPTAYNLVTQVAYDQMMNDLMSALDSNATHYTEGWFYHPGRGWMWTTFSAYPYFYDATDKDWIYFHSGNEKPKFYRYKTKTWLTIE